MTQPKKRVYELARELNMTNKVLLDKISILDLGLSSHMSTLDEGAEARIRQFIQGGPEPDLVEKRVRPTVIRRRRKAAPPVEASPTPEASEFTEVLEAAEEPPVVEETGESETAIETPVAEPVAERTEPVPAEASVAPERRAPEKTRKPRESPSRDEAS